jgi:hypothetical protein
MAATRPGLPTPFGGESGGGGGGFPNFTGNNLGSGLAGLFGGMFGNSGGPYQDAMDQYSKYLDKGTEAQNPFYKAGTGAIGNYQDWLGGMKDPSGFINHLMGQYQQSPWANFQQQQSTRAAQNLGSATGLTGSTPLQMQAQQNASNISSEDMQKWLQNVLGVNTQYGAGQKGLIDTGANSANSLSNMYSDYGKNFGEQAYNKGAAGNNDFWNMIGGGAQLASMFL